MKLSTTFGRKRLAAMMNDDDRDNSNLRKFVKKLNNSDFPAGYQESPIYKEAYSQGHSVGYQEGLLRSLKLTSPVIDSVRNIIELYDAREDHFDE